MSDLALSFEWIDPEGAAGPELRATWARFEVRSGSQEITRLIDYSSRSVRSSLYLPLYPLAEWLATHWWFLFHEVETLGRSTSDRYDERHDIRYAAEGFALPSLRFQPTGDEIALQWRPVTLPAQNLEFTATGSTVLPIFELRQTLVDFISSVIKRLHLQGVEGSLLEQEWNSIQAVGSEEKDFCAAVASLGLDPYVLDEREQQEVLTASEWLPASVLPDFFAAADWPALLVQARQVLGALESSRNNSSNLTSLKDLRKEMAPVSAYGSPWQQGYQLAQRLRQRLHLNGERLDSLPSLGKALEIRSQDLEAAIVKIGDLPGSLDALVANNSCASPGFAVPERRREEAVRFAFCRGLFEYLTVPEGEPLLVTRARSDRQKRNRAFAAEFLVPADLLREALHGRAVGSDEMDDLAAAFGVSPNVIRHQIDNHGLGPTRS